MLDKMSQNSDMNTSTICAIQKHWVPQDSILVLCFLQYKFQQQTNDNAHTIQPFPPLIVDIQKKCMYDNVTT